MSDPGTRYTAKKLAEINKRLVEVYEEAYRDIKEKTDEFARKFAIKDSIYQEKANKGEITWDEYSRWLDGQIFQSEQWEAKRDQIVRILSEANSTSLDIINKESFSVFAENANFQSYSLEHGAGVNFGFGLYDSHAVANLIKNDPRILPTKKLDPKKDKAWNMKKMRSQIVQGIIQGESLSKVAKRLAVATGSHNKNAMLTHARTAMTGAQNAGRYQSLMDAKDMGITVTKQWMATFDARTRDSHASIDGEIRRVGDKWHPVKFSNECRFPGDPEGPPREVYNCRCTLVGDVTNYPSEYERYDNIDGHPVKEMTYREWTNAKGKIVAVGKFQSALGAAKTVDEVNSLMNGQGWFRKINDWNGGVYSKANLTGCDLNSAKSIAASYQQVFEKYPKLKGRLGAPDAHPTGMEHDTYAWCFIRGDGKVQVNPERYNDWNSVWRSYNRDVSTRWHPYGTTAESIVVHEIGHAIDGLLAKEGIKGGVTASGEYRYASSSLRNTIMKRAADQDETIAEYWNVKDWDGKADKFWQSYAVEKSVSMYAAQNPQEWFAECFAEYITSANPRTVARLFGEELEKLIGRLE